MKTVLIPSTANVRHINLAGAFSTFVVAFIGSLHVDGFLLLVYENASTACDVRREDAWY